MKNNTKTVPQKSSSALPQFLLKVLGGVFVILMMVAIWRSCITTDADRFKTMLEVQKQYTNLHDHFDTFFVENIPKEKEAEKIAEVVAKEGERIRKLLASQSGVSEQSISVWNNFKNYATTLQIDEMRTIAYTSAENRPGIREKKEMAFMPGDIAKAHIMSGSMVQLLCWREDIGISICAIDWPDKFVVGALYHEMFHGMRHPIGSKNFFDSHTLEYAMEEMEAHDLESTVLNDVTGGQYFQRFDQIILKAEPNAKNIVAAITIDDLKFFDSILGMEKSGLLPAALAVSQHSFGLAAYHLKKQGKPKHEWGEFFMWLSTDQRVMMQ